MLGLSYLHLNDIDHCDLKPGNILVFNKGQRFKIIDLGLAQFKNSSGKLLGNTDPFMALEAKI